MQDSPPQERSIWPPNVNGARVEKPSFKKRGRRIRCELSGHGVYLKLCIIKRTEAHTAIY